MPKPISRILALLLAACLVVEVGVPSLAQGDSKPSIQIGMHSSFEDQALTAGEVAGQFHWVQNVEVRCGVIARVVRLLAGARRWSFPWMAYRILPKNWKGQREWVSTTFVARWE